MNKRRSKQISKRKIGANQANALRSTGPQNSALTRYNALRHGLLAEGVTVMDDPASFPGFCSRLEDNFAPIGEVEKALVRRVALCLVRLRRAARIEAEFITEKLNPAKTRTVFSDGSELHDLVETVIVDPGMPASLSTADVEELQTLQRYETSIEGKLYRALHQVERMQRMRRGDNISAPASLDVTIHRESADVASFGNPGD